MSKRLTSIRLPELTDHQLTELASATGLNVTELLTTAIDRMYQQEIKTMTTKTIIIEKITTKPEHDPYTNIEGITSTTCLKLDPRDPSIWVTQEYNDHSTPSDEWHHLVLTWKVPGHPTESSLQEWIEEHMSDFQTICNGYEVVWNGSNHVGQLTDEARSTKESIEFELDNGDGLFRNYYEYWSVEQWTDPIMSSITATSTDEELRQLAKEVIDALDSNQLLDDDEDGVYSYFAKRRDELADEQ